ncbi:Ornithine carbamoyltransferase [Fructilactobacillus florum 8D]|uniref:Ornithine carbamoyltransferase n=1 Tax=Fructilactobacillus florum 8D TaxID=1221538 RepID=W9EFF1_9LACO|nr:ornithine carbamoyltransferase [Fructilactobacillus florum]EKK20587.1 Ornithine carbamoyltransferase [Fructilactobacillus florum 2F]ETO40807.1 Ornithine carbamoyltransferase [Fructilactobacillus florum 8D]
MTVLNKLKGLQGRSFLKEVDFTPAQLEALIEFASQLKQEKQQHGRVPQYLHDKSLILLFQKTSTRTRLSFELGGAEMGAHVAYIDPTSSQFGTKESIEDSGRVFGELADGIEYRGFAQQDLETLATAAQVPVWNGLSNEWHPTQMIADFLTIKENFGHLRGINLAYVGDGRNNVANSLLVTGSMLGVNVHIVAPPALQPSAAVQQKAQTLAQQSGARPLVTADIEKGVRAANVIYTDVWVSMGEHNWQARIDLLRPYQVNSALLEKTKTPTDQLIFMHCLPAFHDGNTTTAAQVASQCHGLDGPALEVTDTVFRSKYARQFQEAGNRKPAIMAIMAATLGDLTLF